MIGSFPLYLAFIVPGILLGLWAQIKLSAAFSKYSRVGLASGLTGAEAAREILDRAGLVNMPVHEVGGHLTDHFDPTKRALFLSSDNYHGRSVAAVGVAAHEAGHALQQLTGYGMFQLRMALVPITQFASYAWMGILVVGAILHWFAQVLPIAIAIFSILTLFHLITLPVEFDASRRAKEQLFRLGLVHSDEYAGVTKVLNAAAFTYVAAMITTVLTLIYWLTVARNQR